MAEMSPLPRTFASCSSADKGRYDLICAWKAQSISTSTSRTSSSMRRSTRRRRTTSSQYASRRSYRADTFLLLIGNDTYTKTLFVKGEVETAVEKECRLIGANLNNCRFKDELCPVFFANVGALFVPFSSRIIAEALNWQRHGASPSYYFSDEVYTRLRYQLIGNTAVLPPPPNPFGGGNRPPWAT